MPGDRGATEAMLAFNWIEAADFELTLLYVVACYSRSKPHLLAETWVRVPDSEREFGVLIAVFVPSRQA